MTILLGWLWLLLKVFASALVLGFGLSLVQAAIERK